MATTITITPDSLANSAVKFRKELLIAPVIAAEATLKHMRGISGIQSSVVLGEMGGSAELAPYRKGSDATLSITGRELATYLGSHVTKFDPNSVRNTVYGSLVTQGEALKNVDINKAILMFLAMQIGSKLGKAVWDGVRDANGTTTAKLFDGFDTITAAEISEGTIAAGNGNYFAFAEAITSLNAVDMLQDFVLNHASDELQDRQSKLYIPRTIYNAYCKDYQTTVGAVPYNKEYKKTFLEGTDNNVELVPMVGKKNSAYIHLSPLSNMCYGYGAGVDTEKIVIEKHDVFDLSFALAMNFGVQFESIGKESLLVGALYTEPEDDDESEDVTP